MRSLGRRSWPHGDVRPSSSILQVMRHTFRYAFRTWAVSFTDDSGVLRLPIIVDGFSRRLSAETFKTSWQPTLIDRIAGNRRGRHKYAKGRVEKMNKVRGAGERKVGHAFEVRLGLPCHPLPCPKLHIFQRLLHCLGGAEHSEGRLAGTFRDGGPKQPTMDLSQPPLNPATSPQPPHNTLQLCTTARPWGIQHSFGITGCGCVWGVGGWQKASCVGGGGGLGGQG